MEYFIQPIKLEKFNLYRCDGTFAGGQPFLKQKDGTYELKPNEDCFIGTALDGQRSFIPLSTVSSRGIKVTPNEDGGVSINMTLPME